MICIIIILRGEFMKNKKRNNFGLSLGMIFGCGLGIVLGSILNQITWGIIIGSATGLIVGSVYDLQNKSSDGKRTTNSN